MNSRVNERVNARPSAQIHPARSLQVGIPRGLFRTPRESRLLSTSLYLPFNSQELFRIKVKTPPLSSFPNLLPKASCWDYYVAPWPLRLILPSHPMVQSPLATRGILRRRESSHAFPALSPPWLPPHSEQKPTSRRGSIRPTWPVWPLPLRPQLLAISPPSPAPGTQPLTQTHFPSEMFVLALPSAR